ncbi:hypothetical protein GCM10023149_35520 [Mucilaginibacter gynuensis]|uniref:Uncharacterized protein n=1 Tax=Mucilaginibacter gynuensis TaxID=1302236 RepID=A0ABP8GVA5_9SPHI
MATAVKDNKIWSDGICVYVDSKVINPTIGKVALLIANPDATLKLI